MKQGTLHSVPCFFLFQQPNGFVCGRSLKSLNTVQRRNCGSLREDEMRRRNRIRIPGEQKTNHDEEKNGSRDEKHGAANAEATAMNERLIFLCRLLRSALQPKRRVRHDLNDKMIFLDVRHRV